MIYGSTLVVFPDDLGIEPYTVSWPEIHSNLPPLFPILPLSQLLKP